MSLYLEKSHSHGHLTDSPENLRRFSIIYLKKQHPYWLLRTTVKARLQQSCGRSLRIIKNPPARHLQPVEAIFEMASIRFFASTYRKKTAIVLYGIENCTHMA
jgi:hypothetical protein